MTEKHPLRSHGSPHARPHLLRSSHTWPHLVHVLSVLVRHPSLPHARLELLLVGPHYSKIVWLLLQMYCPVSLLLLLLLQQLLLLLLMHHVAPHATHVGHHLLGVLRLRLHALRINPWNVARQPHVATPCTSTTTCAPMLSLFDEGGHEAGVGLENLQHLLLLLR